MKTSAMLAVPAVLVGFMSVGEARENATVTELNLPVLKLKSPKEHQGDFNLHGNATIDADIGVGSSFGFIGAIWQDRDESVEGFSTKPYKWKATASLGWEAYIVGTMSITAEVDSGPGIFTGGTAATYGYMSAKSQVLKINEHDEDAAVVSNLDGTVSIGVSGQLGSLGGSLDITPGAPASGPQSRLVAIAMHGFGVGSMCALTLSSVGKVDVNVDAFGLLRSPGARGVIANNNWQGSFVDAYCETTGELQYHWSW